MLLSFQGKDIANLGSLLRPYFNGIAMRMTDVSSSELLFSDQTFTWAHKMLTTVTLNSDTKWFW